MALSTSDKTAPMYELEKGSDFLQRANRTINVIVLCMFIGIK